MAAALIGGLTGACSLLIGLEDTKERPTSVSIGGHDAASTSSSTSSSSSSGGGSDGGVTCGKLSLLAWDFKGSGDATFVVDPKLATNANAAEGTVPIGTGTFISSTISHRYYDFVDSSVSIEFRHIPDPTDSYTQISLSEDSDQVLTGYGFVLGVNGANIFCAHAGPGGDVQMFPYLPATQRWWRLRHESAGGGTVYCETSQDGQQWTSPFQPWHLSVLSIPSPTAVKFVLLTHGTVGTPDELKVANLNYGAASGSWCKASSFTDQFTTPAMPTNLPVGWGNAAINPPGSVDQAGDTLNFHLVGAPGASSYYQSSTACDMRGERISVQILSPLPADTDAKQALQITNDPKNFVSLELTQNGLICNLKGSPVGKTSIQSFPAYVSFREQHGVLTCELYRNMGWESFGTATGGVDPSAVDVRLLTVDPTTPPDGGAPVVSFDNYNIPPP